MKRAIRVPSAAPPSPPAPALHQLLRLRLRLRLRLHLRVFLSDCHVPTANQESCLGRRDKKVPA